MLRFVCYKKIYYLCIMNLMYRYILKYTVFAQFDSLCKNISRMCRIGRFKGIERRTYEVLYRLTTIIEEYHEKHYYPYCLCE